MNTKLGVAFYKGKGRFIDKWIRWWTNSPYSHCELILPDSRMFSADAWSNEVRFTTYYNLDNWDVISFEITAFQELNLLAWCDSKEGAKYDWFGVAWFVLPFIKQQRSKWFCSEVCGSALKYIGKIPVITKTSKLSPQGLFDLLKGK